MYVCLGYFGCRGVNFQGSHKDPTRIPRIPQGSQKDGLRIPLGSHVGSLWDPWSENPCHNVAFFGDILEISAISVIS